MKLHNRYITIGVICITAMLHQAHATRWYVDTMVSETFSSAIFLESLESHQLEKAYNSLGDLAYSCAYYNERIRFYQEELSLLHVAYAYSSPWLAQYAVSQCGDSFSSTDIYGNPPSAYNGACALHKISEKTMRPIKWKAHITPPAPYNRDTCVVAYRTTYTPHTRNTQ